MTPPIPPDPPSEPPFPEDLEDMEEDPTSADLVAYLDGELDADDAEVLEDRISQDPKLRAQVDSLKQTWALLDHLPRPEPSPDFTQRTLEQLQPASDAPAAPSGPATMRPAMTPSTPTPTIARSAAAPTRSTATSVPTLVPEPRSRWRFFVPLGMAALTAFFAGYWMREVVAERLWPASDPNRENREILDNLHLLKNLRLYENVDNIQFLKDLDHPELFGDGSPGT